MKKRFKKINEKKSPTLSETDVNKFFDDYIKSKEEITGSSSSSKSCDNDKKEEFNSSIKVNCTHEEIIDDKNSQICKLCGITLDKSLSTEQEWRYYGSNDSRHSSDPSRVQIRKTDEKNIYKDLEKYGFPEKIKEDTNALYLKVSGGSILRSNSRLGLIFVCVLEAYKNIGKIKTTEELQNIIKIPKKEISKGLKYLRLKNRETAPSYISPIDFIQQIMENFNSNKEHINNVVNKFNKIQNKSSFLNGSKPRSVACGVIYHYLKSQGKDVNIDDFSKIVDLSGITINRIVSEINNILPDQEKIQIT